MNTSLHDKLIQILEIIGFTDDKDKFVKEFIHAVSLQTYLNMLSLLTPTSEQKLKSEMEGAEKDPGQMLETLKKHFTEIQIQKVFSQTYKKTGDDWIKEINNTLTDTQRQQLMALPQSS